MYAVAIEQGTLVWRPHDIPQPGPGEIRIRVVATAVNRADLLQVAGHYPPPSGASAIPGLECAGVVDAIGEGVERWRVGDAVCALLSGGGYAEQVVCPAAQALPCPSGLSLAQAAALPEVFATAWLNLVQEGGVELGSRVLVHAGASGVGTAAIQICKLLGADCYITVGSPEKLARCVALGAQGGHDRHQGSFLQAEWAQEPFDVILDPVGAAYLSDNLRALALDGRLVLIGLLGGRTAEIDLGRLLVKRQRVIGSTLRSRSVQKKGEIMGALARQVWPAVATGEVVPVIHEVLPIQKVAQAHALLASNHTFGKVVLTMPGADAP